VLRGVFVPSLSPVPWVGMLLEVYARVIIPLVIPICSPAWWREAL